MVTGRVEGGKQFNFRKHAAHNTSILPQFLGGGGGKLLPLAANTVHIVVENLINHIHIHGIRVLIGIITFCFAGFVVCKCGS